MSSDDQVVLPAGATYFTRCGACQTFYRPDEAISLSGKPTQPHWFRPRPVRKPVPCDHPLEKGEIWYDGAWHAPATEQSWPE